MDILVGDLLVVGGLDYPISAVARYDSHDLLPLDAPLSCKTQRAAAIGSDGKRASTETVDCETGLFCTHLDPVNPHVQRTPLTRTPQTLVETFIDDGTDYLHLELIWNKRRPS